MVSKWWRKRRALRESARIQRCIDALLQEDLPPTGVAVHVCRDVAVVYVASTGLVHAVRRGDGVQAIAVTPGSPPIKDRLSAHFR